MRELFYAEGYLSILLFQNVNDTVEIEHNIIMYCFVIAYQIFQMVRHIVYSNWLQSFEISLIW